MTLKESALMYARLGIAIVPLKPRDKYPLLKNWQNLATSDIHQIESWWSENPHYNIGMVTGTKSGGVVVLDLDEHPEEGKFGIEYAEDWQREHGRFPDTWESVSGSGGRHLFFQTAETPKRAQHLFHDSVDFQADEALIVLPPSVHPNGKEYYWDLSPEDTDIASIDVNVWNFIEKGLTERDGGNPVSSSEDCSIALEERINEGHRVDTMHRLLSRLKALGLSEDVIRASVKRENDSRCNPPLTDEELEKQVFPSLHRYEKNDASAYYHPFRLPDKLERLNRINYLYKTILYLKSKNLSDKAIRSAISIENEDRCCPPLSPEDLEDKVFVALKKYKGGGKPLERRRQVVRLSEISSLE